MRLFKPLLYCLLITSFQSSAQTNREVLDSLYSEIEFLIGEPWFLEETNKGFQVTYCRSCHENYMNYIDSTDLFSRERSRLDFFRNDLIDSVSYFSIVSNAPIPRNWSDEQRIEYFTELYQANDILQFKVIVDEQWSSPKTASVLSKNNQLKDSILKEPLYKSNMDIFSDYRFWLPSEYWKRRTQGLNFYFERMPYESLIIDQAIFILHNKPFFFAQPLLVDKMDSEYFFKEQNYLEDERRRTLKIIALTLGIHDYKIVN